MFKCKFLKIGKINKYEKQNERENENIDLQLFHASFATKSSHEYKFEWEITTFTILQLCNAYLFGLNQH